MNNKALWDSEFHVGTIDLGKYKCHGKICNGKNIAGEVDIQMCLHDAAKDMTVEEIIGDFAQKCRKAYFDIADILEINREAAMYTNADAETEMEPGSVVKLGGQK